MISPLTVKRWEIWPRRGKCNYSFCNNILRNPHNIEKAILPTMITKAFYSINEPCNRVQAAGSTEMPRNKCICKSIVKTFVVFTQRLFPLLKVHHCRKYLIIMHTFWFSEANTYLFMKYLKCIKLLQILWKHYKNKNLLLSLMFTCPVCLMCKVLIIFAREY